MIKLSKVLNIKVLQQVMNQKSKQNIEDLYKKNYLDYELFEFDDNLLARASNYDLAITRSGASTISELSYLNIPFIAIPYPYAKDNHQYFNSKFYKNKNCCWLISQKDINENNFMELLNNILKNKNDYFVVKNNLKQLNKQNTWEKNKEMIIELINED